jgi:hypothetical protein
MAIKIIYTLFLALMVALFVGLGIDTFYEGPKMPEYPLELEMQKPECNESAEIKAVRENFAREQRAYAEEIKPYNRNVSIISLIAAIVILVVSLTMLTKIKMIADGILLGGVFTTAYSIIRGLMSQNSQYRFIIVAMGLIIALTLGYLKFIRPRVSK